MPYPMHLTVQSQSLQTQSLPNLHTESDVSSLTNARFYQRMYRISAPATARAPVTVIQRSTSSRTSSSSGLTITIKRAPARRGLGKVFTGIKKMVTRSKQASMHISEVCSLKRSGRAGYVTPKQYGGTSTEEKKDLAKQRGRVAPGCGYRTKSSKRSRHVDSAMSGMVRMASQHLSTRGSMIPDLVVTGPTDSGLRRAPSFTKGDDAASMVSVRPSRLFSDSHLFVANPGSVSSSAATSPVAEDFTMSGALPESDEDSMDIDSFESMLESNLLPSAQVPPSLHFIARSASIDPDQAFLPPTSPTRTSEDIQRHRDEAFHILESGFVVPRSGAPVLLNDIPASLRPQAHPQSLLPGPRYKDSEGVERVRPTTWSNGKPHLPFEPFSPDDYECFNPQVKYLWPPTSKKIRSRVRHNGNRPTTPDAFAAAEQHKSHYARVESGEFDAPVLPENPSAPSSTSSVLSRSRKDYSLYGDSKDSASTPALERKSVPTAPLPALPFSDRVPQYHKMNDNGYPKANLSEAGARYSTTPCYCPRTVDSVEAKYKKGTKEYKAREKTEKKEAKAAAKADAKAAKQAEKDRKKQDKKDAQRPELVHKQKQLDRSLKKLLFV